MVNFFVNVYFTLSEDKPWAKKGYIQMEEQLPVRSSNPHPSCHIG